MRLEDGGLINIFKLTKSSLTKIYMLPLECADIINEQEGIVWYRITNKVELGYSYEPGIYLAFINDIKPDQGLVDKLKCINEKDLSFIESKLLNKAAEQYFKNKQQLCDDRYTNNINIEMSEIFNLPKVTKFRLTGGISILHQTIGGYHGSDYNNMIELSIGVVICPFYRIKSDWEELKLENIMNNYNIDRDKYIGVYVTYQNNISKEIGIIKQIKNDNVVMLEFSDGSIRECSTDRCTINPTFKTSRNFLKINIAEFKEAMNALREKRRNLNNKNAYGITEKAVKKLNDSFYQDIIIGSNKYEIVW